MKSLRTRDNSRLKLEVLAISSEISPSLERRILLDSDDGRTKEGGCSEVECRNIGDLQYHEYASMNTNA